MALINANTGTALKHREVDGRWQLPKVDGTPDLIEPAFLVLGLSRIANQLWKNESTRLRNIDPKNKITIDLKDEQLWKLNDDGKTLESYRGIWMQTLTLIQNNTDTEQYII